MTFNFNIFRILGDVSHTASKCILIWAIHSNKSAEGVSLITQMLYILVFLTRYLDLFFVSPFADWAHTWNFTLKLFYISSSLYIVFLMMRVFARTREREKSWKMGVYSLGGAAAGAPIVYFIFKSSYGRSGFGEVLWTFSIILESICVLPQLLLLRQTTVPTVIDTFYLVTLGSYRGFYILNWIVRGATEYGYKDPTSWAFGIIQTALYIDFAWVYFTRQRVKLRYGGVVDSEDFSRGFIVSKLLGRKSGEQETFDDVEDHTTSHGHGDSQRPHSAGRWGTRGISVSADDTLNERDSRRKPGKGDDENAPLADPDTFEDDEDEDAQHLETPPSTAPGSSAGNGHETGIIGDGAEWREGDAK